MFSQRQWASGRLIDTLSTGFLYMILGDERLPIRAKNIIWRLQRKEKQTMAIEALDDC